MKSLNKNSTLMMTMIRYFLIIILSMASLNVFSFFQFNSFYSNVYGMITKLVNTYTITVKTGVLFKEIGNYVNSNSADLTENSKLKYEMEYEEEYEKLIRLINVLIADAQGDDYYNYSDIKNMVTSFDDLSKDIIVSYNSKEQKTHINELLSELSRLDGYIQNEVKNILVVQLQATMSYYERFLNIMQTQETMIYLLMSLITIICIIVAVRFSRQISKPIHKLVLGLKKLAQGEFEIVKQAKTNDEVRRLVESYNFMSIRIQNLIQEIKDKADIEAELKEQQIKNLEMTNLLNESELKFLQSQINPHFLYNALNSISALAMYEGADQTMKMIVSISDILKYNLKKINENVTLMEELKIIESYLYIQKSRFGDRIVYNIDYDLSAMGYYIPGMILQPFVENAIIHGLEPKEEQGILNITIKDYKTNIVISIEDNGMGMSNLILEEIQNQLYNNISSKKGIGVSNVIRRLELKYGRDIVTVNSKCGEGTQIKILLPKTDMNQAI